MNHQRIGSKSNAHVGRAFEAAAAEYFQTQEGIEGLTHNFKVPVGFGPKKNRRFDLGNSELLVECKSSRWTASDLVPSAKFSVWTEAMYHFFLAPTSYRKVMFVLRDFSESRGMTVGEYYLQNYGHLVPPGVEFLEYDEETKTVTKLN